MTYDYLKRSIMQCYRHWIIEAHKSVWFWQEQISEDARQGISDKISRRGLAQAEKNLTHWQEKYLLKRREAA